MVKQQTLYVIGYNTYSEFGLKHKENSIQQLTEWNKINKNILIKHIDIGLSTYNI